jgi:hypothetical protein
MAPIQIWANIHPRCLGTIRSMIDMDEKADWFDRKYIPEQGERFWMMGNPSIRHVPVNE